MRIVRQMSFVDRLRRFHDGGPDRTAIASAGLGDPRRLSRGDWDRQARAIAARLRQDTRVLVLLPSGLDFYVAFAGVLYAGACAVPAVPPVEGRTRFVDLALDADIDAVLTTSAIAATAKTLWAERGAPTVRWVELDDPSLGAEDSWSPPNIDADDLALLQYTSGSTGDPKGVAVSHRILTGWLDVWADRVDLPVGSSVVTWVPAHHVLGLSFVLMAPQLDGQATLLTPEDVMADPLCWLRAVSAAEGPVLSGAPPFGYQHCVDVVAPEERLGLDLTGWDVAVIGSERIRGEVLDTFAKAYAPAGFRRSAFFTGYGTSETMMAAAHRGPAEPMRLTVDATELEHRRVRHAEAGTNARTVELVACGQPGAGLDMVIVDPESMTPCAAGRLGELWIRGRAIAEGYWRRPEQTENTFRARLADGSGPYLRTGDLAFLHGDELVPCGRLSELIIIRGRNLIPHDIESTVRSADPVLAEIPVAVFAVDDARGEQLVVVAAVDRDAAEDIERLVARVRRAIITDHEVQPHAVHFVEPGGIPLTITGKVQHRACKQDYLDGKLRPTASANSGTAQPATAREAEAGDQPRLAVVQEAVQDRIGALVGESAADVPVDSPLIQLGLDSMNMIKLRAGLAADFAVVVPMERLAGYTVATLAAALVETPGRAGPGPAVGTAQAIPDPGHRHEPFGLTELQHAYLVGRSGGYTLGGVGTHFYAEFETSGLDVPRLHEAWVRLVERHDMLRAVVSSDGDQRVQASVEVPLFPTTDLRCVDYEQAAEEIVRTRAEMSHRVFTPDSWPLFDIRVSRLPGGLDRVHVSLDLLVLDVWSLHILSREWRQLYQAPNSELRPLAVTFRDYVIATERRVDGEEQAKQYWMSRLDSLPGGPELPLRCSPDALTGPPTFVRRQARLDPPQWTRLSVLAAAAGLTTSSVLLAAYATVLGAWSRRSRFTLNVPTFNRLPLHEEIDTVIGDFTSVTLLEVDLVDAKNIVDLAIRLQGTLWRDLEHRDYNGVRVLRELARRRGPDAGVLAPVVFSSASGQATDGAREMPLSWLGELVFGVSQTPQVLIDNQLIETAGGLDFNWDTVDELFADGAVDEMFAAYRGLLEQLADGDHWHDELPVLLPAAQGELIARVNETGGDVPPGTLFAALVEQAKRAPDRVAVITDDVELTFGDLYRRARGLAHVLEQAGVVRNQPVAVSVPKGAAQVVAVLGVQLAGGAYLPVDTELPVPRQDRLLALGGCLLVVCGKETTRESWPDDVTPVTVDLSGDPGVGDPQAVVGQDDLAYVIFTSGSTGEPKGVAVSHRAALNTCVDVNERFGVGPDDRVLGLSSLSFDLSVWDIFGVLGAGGAVVLPAARDRRDPARWLDLVRRHRVTIWNSVPALAQMFADYARDAESLSLRLVLLSGDWIPVDLPDRVRAVVPDCRVVSLGGATEAGIWSIFHDIAEVDPSWESIPYGKPLRNQRFSVLNDRWQDCPVQVVGELFIGGDGLADGYFADGERTAAAFVSHPETGERLYRTGDLGRRRPDGTIEFLGREDFQVKVGGYRIELGEIEAAITSHPGVRSAVVTALGDRHHRRLAACVVPETGPTTGPRSAASLAPEFVTAADRQCMIFDELERLEFKVARHGVRADLTGVPVALHTDGAASLRASHRQYGERLVPIADLAGLLDRVRSHDGPAMPKYAYASAGNSYAVQTYVYVADGTVDGLAGGTYYHDPVGHRLLSIRPGATLSDAVRFGADQHALDTAAFALFFVAAMDAVRPLYGAQAARDLCLIETGLIAQLLEDGAADNHVGVCQLTVVAGEESLRESFELGGDHEVLHAMIGGARLRAGERPADPAAQRADDEAILVRVVREYLTDRLPDYMVPTHIVVTERLPLTPTGKVDRGALEHLVATGRKSADADPPAGELETRIVEVFQQVLGIDAIGVHAGFFDLGADSTSIVRAYRLLKASLDQKFALTDMFEHGSVRKLATALSRVDTGEPDEVLRTARRRADLGRAARGRGRTRTEPSTQEGTH